MNKTMTVEPKIEFRSLPLKFEGKGEVSGYSFKQIFRSDNWYVYEVSINGKTSHFEIFLRKEKPAGGFAKENYIPYPKSNSFGVWAWTVRTLEEAIELMNRKEN